jgi:hypothetical protein
VGWDKGSGKPVKGSVNKYVSALLYSKELLEPFSLAVNKNSYEITGVSCEKILINKEKLPYDGICWVSIRND